MLFVAARTALIAALATALASLGACSTHVDASPGAPVASESTIAKSAPLAVASPVAGVSPPFAMDPPVTGRPAAGDRTLGSAASDGAGFLVVWHDQRAPQAQGLTYAARVDAAGGLLDPAGIVLGARCDPDRRSDPDHEPHQS